ncbi:MAG TPA: glycosyltransferase [Steroidobacteraceae bacterium]
MRSSAADTTRLCILTPHHSTTLPGGAEYQIDCLLNVLTPLKRYEIYYLAGIVAETSAGHPYQLLQIGRSRHAPRFGYLTQAVPLYRLLRRLLPDVIYQRVACGYTGVAAYYARRHGARLVWHVAHDTDVTPQGSLDGRNPVRRFLEKRSVEYAIGRADCIVAQTTHQARLLELHYRRAPDAIIPNFHPQPQEPIDKSGPLRVVWVASLKPFKHPEIFVRLAAALQDRADTRFVMIGPQAGGSGIQGWSDSLLQSIRATPNIDYLGPQSQAEVNRVLASAHLFVNTSRYEGFPNTFIQAWMRDAVVVSLSVDPDELLSRRALGIYCEGCEQRLHEQVRALLANPALRTQLAQRARSYANCAHSLANAQALVQLLDRRTCPQRR